MPPRAAIIQNAYLVPNLEEACRTFHTALGIGPFLTGARGVLYNHVYRGVPAEPIRIKGAFVQTGDIVFELIELVSDGASAFRDMAVTGATTFHHQAYFTRDYEAERDAMIAAGYPVVSEFTVSFGAQICYVDTRPLLGHMLELYPDHPVIHGMYRRTREAAEQWDGRELMLQW